MHGVARVHVDPGIFVDVTGERWIVLLGAGIEVAMDGPVVVSAMGSGEGAVFF